MKRFLITLAVTAAIVWGASRGLKLVGLDEATSTFLAGWWGALAWAIGIHRMPLRWDLS